MNFTHVDTRDTSLLKILISKLGASSNTFRYFESRDLDSCLPNHEKTILLVDHSKPIGYGHLDRDRSDKKIWLGIALLKDFTGKGFGKKIMRELLEDSSEDIYLSVDTANIAGQKLYLKFGFEIIKSNSIIIYMKKSYA